MFHRYPICYSLPRKREKNEKNINIMIYDMIGKKKKKDINYVFEIKSESCVITQN